MVVRPIRSAFGALVLAALGLLGQAQELPLRVWSVRDGLVQSRVNDVLRHSNG